MSLNIVILDGIYANPGDLSWESLKQLGNVTLYKQTSLEEVIRRSDGAEVLVINKIRLGAEQFDQLPNLKMVAISATGTDNVDIKAAEERNILVRNAVGYSTNSVAQHVFALILALTNRVAEHDLSVRNDDWDMERGFSYTLSTIPELSGKRVGIYGFGKIGQRVARIAEAFDMEVAVVSGHARPDSFPSYHFMEQEELFSSCDIVSLHAPLKTDNKGIVNADLLKLMKPTSYLINTARGGLVNEEDLAKALRNKQLAGAGLDVLRVEPPTTNHVLHNLENCIITPHMAWTSKEARKKLIDMVASAVREFRDSCQIQ